MNGLNNLFFSSVITLLIIIITGCRHSTEDSSGMDIVYPNLEVGKTITVSSPVDREIYKPGETILIKWTTSAPKVDIFLYRKTVLKISIRQNLESVSEILWQIPDNIPNSNHYKIKLVNSFNEEGFGYSGMFGIQGD